MIGVEFTITLRIRNIPQQFFIILKAEHIHLISTHSPFLLALPGAKIINLDDQSRVVDSWTELKNPRVYYVFFKKHADEFEKTD